MCDVNLPNGKMTRSPHRDAFLQHILPQLDILKETKQVTSTTNGPSQSESASNVKTTEETGTSQTQDKENGSKESVTSTGT